MNLFPNAWCRFSIDAIFLNLICKASIDAASTFMFLFLLLIVDLIPFYIVL